MCGIGCIIGGLFANLPFIIAPPTAISIFLSIFLQQKRLDTAIGNQAVVASGIGLIFLGYRPLGRFLSQVFYSFASPSPSFPAVDPFFNPSWHRNW